MRPKTHVPNLPPMMPKALDEFSDSEEVIDTVRDMNLSPRSFKPEKDIKITVVSNRKSLKKLRP